MKFLAVWIVSQALIGCTSPGPVELKAPAGPVTVLVDISGPEAGPTLKDCVRLRFRDAQTKMPVIVQTPASNAMKWAVGWSDANTVVLYSSDVGILAYDFTGGIAKERPANDAEKEAARAAYQKKYASVPEM